jgi:hypothetical protein
MRQLRVYIIIGTAFVILSCGGLAGLLYGGILPPFKWWFSPDGRHVLVIRHGLLSPECPYPQSACAAAASLQREFDIHTITPDGHGGADVYPLMRLGLPTSTKNRR